MAEPLTVVTFKWRLPGYRAQFTAEHVRTLQRMVARHYPEPHRFVCFTDDPRGLEDVALPLWDDHAEVPNPTGQGRPSCYRRLKLFSPKMKKLIGERIMHIDLDTVIVGDITPLADRDDDFIIWRAKSLFARRGFVYNPSLMLMRAGSRAHVWRKFDPRTSPAAARRAGWSGTDQAIISHALWPKAKIWNRAHGVYSFRDDFIRKGRVKLPAEARIVGFYGSRYNPAYPNIQRRYGWVRRHWRLGGEAKKR